ncbi:hypothetical protein HD601_005931 [Jiangella mangrovi]|uniref:DUF2092 domain-containing protein n=1 Tax=Jiangella mangrovi TaxID=1524084 RepID=A0A7W9GX17_9ACTN|nr:hypothetical protein [Jiangella mangrovi]
MTVRAGLGLAVLAAAGCAAGIGSPGAADVVPSASPSVEPAPAEPSPVAESTPAPAPDDAVPWETIDAFYEAARGRYTEVVQASTDGILYETILQETVRYDLDAPYLERTVRIPTAGADPLGDLKFVYTDTSILMWNPGAADACGTPWVDMTDVDYGAILGFDTDLEEFLAVKPLDILDWAVDEPRHIETTPEGSTYEVTVPADMTLSITSDMARNPEDYEAILDMEAVVEVLLPPDDGSLRMSVDVTDVYGAIGGGRGLPAGDTAHTSWTLTPEIPEFDTTLPTDVADHTCMDPGTAT